MGSTLNLHSDGASRGNPGPAGAGYLLVDADGREVARGGAALGVTTNNQAEYRALVLGLERALALGCRDVRAHSDSQLMVEQVSGRYKVKDAGLAALKAHALSVLGKFEHWSLSYVPRTQNRDADRLANLAIDGRLDGAPPAPRAEAAPRPAAPVLPESQRVRTAGLAERGPWAAFGTASLDDRAEDARGAVLRWLADAEGVLGTPLRAAFAVEVGDGRVRAHVVLRADEALGQQDVVDLRRAWPVSVGSLMLERARSEEEVGAFLADKLLRTSGELNYYGGRNPEPRVST